MKYLPLLLSILSVQGLLADLPNQIPHQGRVAVDGTNFDGTGQFKFLLFGDEDADHASGNELPVWSNATTTPAGMSEPAAATGVVVTRGLYSVWLGDTSLPNMAALPAEIDPSDRQLYLRIWFDDGMNGFQELRPDQPIGSVPYALLARSASFANQAGTAQSVEARAIRSVHIQDASILGIDLAPGAVATAEVLDGSLQLTDFNLPEIDTRYTPQNAQTIVVDAAGGAAFTTIGAAVNFVNPTAANPVIIEVRAGSYNESVALKSHLHLRGAGMDSTAVLPSGPLAGGVVGFLLPDLTNVTISGFTFTEASGTDADAGIRDVRSSPLIHYCRFVDLNGAAGNADEIGGIVSIGSDPHISRCEFDNEQNGIVLTAGGNALVTTCVFGEASPTTFNMTGIRCFGSDCRVIGNSFSTHEIGVLCESGLPGSAASRIVVAANRFFRVARGVEIGASCHATITGNHIEGIRDSERGIINAGAALISGNTFLNLGDFALVAGGATTNLNGNHVENCGPAGGGQAAAIDGGTVTVSGNSFANNFRDFGPSAPNVGLAWFDSVHLEADPGSGLLAGPRLGVGPTPFVPTFEFEVRGESNFTGKVNLQDELSVAGRTILSDDVLMPGAVQIRELLISEDITQVQNIISSGVVAAGAFRFETTRTYTYNIPGNALVPSRENEDFFHSSLGYVRLEGVDTRFAGTAPVRLPQGARITGYDLMYYDNSGAHRFTNFTTRLRRRNHLAPSTQNIAVLDVASPASANNTTIKVESDNPAQFVSGTATVDNDNFAYFATIDFQVTGNDADHLRCYGFRIHYRLDDLQP